MSNLLDPLKGQIRPAKDRVNYSYEDATMLLVVFIYKCQAENSLYGRCGQCLDKGREAGGILS